MDILNYIRISTYELRISKNEHRMSINEFRIIINTFKDPKIHFWISKSHAELKISVIRF